ncbi:sigma-70 family RNA polymerase sigma factor [Gemmiger sp. An194]|uniref:sigma-70 family RNA polymerase sigma factor n=1 Tax=Gemmiger sp. An194 TaxID=1965582 RepID=UPI000B37D61C|nr:sigma-70 family RNA polymerase sigma factor [Gemmiger sp. An194]OUP23761.1 hypothetical protein B5F28_09660 [Gemmiger sp. An194]
MEETRTPGGTGAQQAAPPLDQRQELNSMLAQLARQGNSAALTQLWEINRPVIRTMFWRWYSRNQGVAESAGVTLEDFDQEGYFAVKEAAEYHNPEKGAFLTALQYFVQHRIQKAILQGRGRYVVTEDGRRVRVSAEPLDSAQSLDEPVPWDDDGEVTRADVTPDPAAAQAFEDAEQNSYLQELRAVLDKALSLLPDRQRNVIAWRFYEGLTLQQAAALDGVAKERIRAIEDAALRALRQNQELRRFYGEDLLSRAYQGTGFGAWKSGGSVQERLVERQEEKERRLAASSTKHLAELLGLDAKELYGFFDDVQQ